MMSRRPVRSHRRRRTMSMAATSILAGVAVAVTSCGSENGSSPATDKETPGSTARPRAEPTDTATAWVSPGPDPFATATATSSTAGGITCPAGGTTVSDAGDLRSALATAKPGTVIRIADGVYKGKFKLSATGTEAAPIWLCGSKDAILDGTEDDDQVNYVLHLDGASWVRVVGFTVRNGQKGVIGDRLQHSIIAQLRVNTIGDEAIHLRTASSDNTVVGNVIRDTGNRREKFGEGVYIGSAESNWCTYTDCEPDRSDRNSVIGNDIAGTTSENIDIKEGTTGGVVRGNTLSSDALVEADSWIDVKGNGWLVEDNIGTGGGTLEDGIQTHVIKKDWGRQNTIRHNTLTVNAKGFGVYIHDGDKTQNVVGCDNQVTGAQSGPSNIDCTDS
ncbi:hypothetical protein CcI49_25120 [Frankia sp. CcI49]|nr:hypothetical protein ACG83_25630 [Frankia sp. R43]ONH57745.1 hypothetical protein CcI49_25120 [Frankia sp. CcI49]